MRLIDIGANLTHDSFDADRDDVIRRAEDAGVTRMILTGASEAGSRHALELARSRPGKFFTTAGVHPHHAADYTDHVHQVLSALTENKEVVAVGECGLDFFRDFSPRDDQRNAFNRQLDIAEATGLPVFLHQRDAHEEFVEILEPRLARLSRAMKNLSKYSNPDWPVYPGRLLIASPVTRKRYASTSTWVFTSVSPVGFATNAVELT